MIVNSENPDQTTVHFIKASPFGQLFDSLHSVAIEMEIWNDDMHRDLPKRWEKHGNMIIIPHNCFKHPNWRLMGPKLWQMVTELLNANRLGRKRVIEGDDFHESHVDLLYGKNGWVEYFDGNIRFFYDVTKCFLNVDNALEKQRISSSTVIRKLSLICLLWNEDAIQALQYSLESNDVQDRCSVIYGDSREITPQNIADRVNLEILPSSRSYWLAACKCLKPIGGILHIHEVIKISKQHTGNSEVSDKPAANSKIIRKGNAKSTKEEFTLNDITDSKNRENRISLENNENKSILLNKSVDNNSMQCEATIIKQVESRTLPSRRIDDRLRKNRWSSINQILRNFAITCATNCTRYLNNHDEMDKIWTCTILEVNVVEIYHMQTNHIVVDLLCQPEDAKQMEPTKV